jgi:hypothetical protein
MKICYNLNTIEMGVVIGGNSDSWDIDFSRSPSNETVQTDN